MMKRVGLYTEKKKQDFLKIMKKTKTAGPQDKNGATKHCLTGLKLPEKPE